MALILKNSQNKQCINIFFKISVSNPKTPLIHHWTKTFPLLNAKSKFQKAKKIETQNPIPYLEYNTKDVEN
jgi:hypothetical protein